MKKFRNGFSMVSVTLVLVMLLTVALSSFASATEVNVEDGGGLAYLIERGLISSDSSVEGKDTFFVVDLVPMLCTYICGPDCTEEHEVGWNYRVAARNVCRYFAEISGFEFPEDSDFCLEALAYDLFFPYGFFGEDYRPMREMTYERFGDFLQDIEELGDVWARDVSQILEENHIVVQGDYLPGRVLYYFYLVPEVIRERFLEEDWVLYYGRDWLASVPEEFENVDLNGLCSYTNKYIGICAASSIPHEFGHFMHFSLGNGKLRQSLYDAESLDGASALLSSYSHTNKNEFYACAFSYWVLNRDDEVVLSELKEVAPRTFEHFMGLERVGWLH